MNERFVSTAAAPTPLQREVAEIVIEECAEVIQRVTKLLRFGPTEIQPGQPYDNAYRVGFEFGDLLEIADLAGKMGVLSNEAIPIGQESKKKQLDKYMQIWGD